MNKNPTQGKAAVTLALRKELGRWLRERREAQQKTMKNIADAVGWGYYNYVGSVESGRAPIASDCYIPYANALGVDPQEFVKRCLQAYDPVAWEILFGAGRAQQAD